MARVPQTHDGAAGRYVAARHRIDALFRGGRGWEHVEATVQSMKGLSEDERAALWLHAFLRKTSSRLGAPAHDGLSVAQGD
jgi:hypothetical protein